MKVRHTFVRLMSIVLAVMLMIGAVPAYAAMPTDPGPSKAPAEKREVKLNDGAKGGALRSSGAPSGGEHTYAVDYFPEAYASGYINLGHSTGENAVGCGSHTNWWGDPAWRGTNHSKDTGIYIDYYNGACMGGQFLDVRTYIWATGASSEWSIQKLDASNPWGGYMAVEHEVEGERSITREFHFYQPGHCGDPNYEVTFRGVLCACDIDASDDDLAYREFICFAQGFQDAWLNNPTTLEKRNWNTWWGTEGTDENFDSGKVWVTVIGSPSAPLTMVYGGTKSGYGAGIDYVGCRTTYIIQDTSEGHPPVSRTSWTSGAAMYSVYTLDGAESVPRWQFMGWYTNSAMTSAAPSRYNPLTSDMTFYGYYQRSLFSVTTSCTNGTITPSDNNVSRGSTKVISYSPSSGYLLTEVKVDGSNVDLASYPDSYTFSNVTADHTVAVTYVAPSASKNWA